MLSTLLALFLVWVIYLWLDRQHLHRLLKPNRSTPAHKPPPRLEFDNPQRIAEINRTRRRAKWVPPDRPPTDRKTRSPQRISAEPPRKPPSKPQFTNSRKISEVNQAKRQPTGAEPPSIPPASVQPFPSEDLPQTEEKPLPPLVLAKAVVEPLRVRSITESRLLRLVNYDRQMAERLAESVRAKNPDKTEQWCWEKAIWDLERDRQ